jgi:hypothetical protein
MALGLSKLYYASLERSDSQLVPKDFLLVNQQNFTPSLLDELHHKFYNVRHSWNRQVDKFRHLLGQSLKPVKLKKFSSSSYVSKDVFDIILLLLIAETNEDRILALNSLQEVFADFPSEVEFYIPQLLMFLLYGAFEFEETLKRNYLVMCEHNPSFASKVYFFVESFCLNKSNDSSPTKLPLSTGDSNFSFHLDPESINALIQFQILVKAAGGKSCHLFVQKSDPFNSSYGEECSMSYGSMGSSTHLYPPFLTFHQPSQSLEDLPLLETVSTAKTASELHFPFHLTKPGLAQLCSSEIYHFDLQISFWNELIQLTRDLFLLSSNSSAKTHLSQVIADINQRFLPSSVIHLPLGNVPHRIWKIHCEECSVFSTKERTPVLFCFEVLFIDSPHR